MIVQAEREQRVGARDVLGSVIESPIVLDRLSPMGASFSGHSNRLGFIKHVLLPRWTIRAFPNPSVSKAVLDLHDAHGTLRPDPRGACGRDGV
jgi:hypothetical protein